MPLFKIKSTTKLENIQYSANTRCPHTLPQPESLTRIQTFLPKLKSRHADKISGLTAKWSGNICEFQFSVYGFKVSGELIVNDSVVEINGGIPLLLMPLKSTIEAIIREQAKKLLK